MTDTALPKETEDARHHGEPKLRPCLRCQGHFHSEWAGERICPRCKGTSAWRSGIPSTAVTSGKR
jgi:DnaJ-class molecular chaperone